ncbi:MAG: 3-deoxy-D-manno-octulosonic acid transferase [Acidobacteriota bacterium]|jgi:3-deoxy-D-manno-octulosonic-acid transferase
MYLVYDIGIRLALVAGVPYFLLRGLREPGFLRGWRERLGRLPADANPFQLTGIWIQAVSVGEVMLAGTLVGAIRARTHDVRIYVSSTTATGRATAERTLAGTSEARLYFPLDLGSAVGRTLDHLRPALFIALETEIWPNLLRALGRRGIPAVVVNGRISPRAFRRYRRARFFFRRVLRHLDLAMMQTGEDAARMRELGMPPERIVVTGNLKFDAPAPTSDPLPLAAELGLRPGETVCVAGSTVEGEEAAVLDAFGQAAGRLPGALLILAPRHPQRFDAVASLLEARGERFVRRSELPARSGVERRVILLDSLGELAALYGLATVVFVGGSLVPAGGHNILEPAVHGRPVIFGPFMDNFREVADRMTAGGGGFQVADTTALAEAMVRLGNDAELRSAAGRAAREVVEANRGALERTLEHLAPYLRRFGPVSC